MDVFRAAASYSEWEKMKMEILIPNMNVLIKQLQRKRQGTISKSNSADIVFVVDRSSIYVSNY